jgi:polar amino acid transport system substrate-binding protein
MKKVICVILMMIMSAAMIAGCGSKNANGGSGEKQKTETAGWNYIKDKGKLIIGLDDTFAPMGFRDEKNELVGFDIDLAKAVGEKLGIEIVFQPIDWNAKEMELSSKRIDCIWNGMSATEDRQKSMALTKKYLNNKIVIMTMDNSVAVDTAEDLKDFKIGTQTDSAALETMQNNEAYDSFSANITEYNTYDEAILDMQAGRIDCIVVDQVLGEYKNNQMDMAMKECSFNFGDDFYAIGCRQGETDLADKISDAIQALIDDGTAADISTKWFGKDIVILEGYDK